MQTDLSGKTIVEFIKKRTKEKNTSEIEVAKCDCDFRRNEIERLR